jgi:hypothetical protein
VICAPFAVWYLVNALAPEIQADPNVYHLMPALDSLRHRGSSDAISFYDRLPHAFEMLYIPAWRIGGASAAKMVHFAFLLATLPVITYIAQRLGAPDYAGFAAAGLYFCTPIVGFSGTSAYNDAALVYFSLAAVALAIDDHPVYAGLFAGLCYAVKMTGLVAVPVALAFFIARKQWKAAAICACSAVLVCSPWLIRNVIATGNPFAPFFNHWFPNPYFYAATEDILRTGLRSYGVSGWQRAAELLWGSQLQGIIGPVFLLAPLALLALRRRVGVVLLPLAMAFSAAWWLNAGARFLMPAIPFLALAMCAALPRSLAFAILTLHAITCWPPIVSLYAPGALRLRQFPWQAAIRLESDHDYLTRVSEDYRFAKLTQTNTPANARIFDMVGVHAAHINREFVGSWQSSQGVRLLAGLEFALHQGGSPLIRLEANFTPRPVCGLRILKTYVSAAPWNIHAIELRYNGNPIDTRTGWTASASKAPYDLPFAFDRNLVSKWSTWASAGATDYIQVEIVPPVIADSVRILPAVDARLEICSEGRWETIALASQPNPTLNLRPAAVAMLKRAGITHIVTPVAYQGIGTLGDKLVNEADNWNLEVVTNLYSRYLLKLR